MGFEADTAVERIDETTFSAEIHPGWDIAGNANGGYLLAMVARAVAESTGKPDPVVLSAHFLAPGSAGPVTISVDTVRVGGRHATAVATMRSSDVALIVAVATTTDLARIPSGGPELIDDEPPDLPDVDACVNRALSPGEAPSFMGRVDLRLHPDDAGFLEGKASGKARVRGWFRLRDDEPIDPIGLLLAVDGFPPTIFNADHPVAWTPTVELTAHVRGVPEPGWLSCAFTTRFLTGGYLEEDGVVWDERGRLIAQSRQLALVPRQPDSSGPT
jgi:acyl-CoA thioesterase